MGTEAAIHWVITPASLAGFPVDRSEVWPNLAFSVIIRVYLFFISHSVIFLLSLLLFFLIIFLSSLFLLFFDLSGGCELA